jgi:hypothetical protein
MHIMGLLLLLLDDSSNATGAAMAAIGAYTVFIVIIGLVFLVLYLIINWRIAVKAGYPGALSLLMLIPLVHFIVLLLFAFTEWPIERELKALRGGGRTLTPTA